jgi:hypothetical protein
MVFNATFNNIWTISSRLVLLVEEIGVPGENNRPTNLSHNVVFSTPRHERGSNSLLWWWQAFIAQDKVFKSYTQVLVYNMNNIHNVFYIKNRYKRFLVII